MAHLTDAINTMVTEQMSERQQYTNDIAHALDRIKEAGEWVAGAANFGNPAQRKELRKIRKDIKKLKNRLITVKGQP